MDSVPEQFGQLSSQANSVEAQAFEVFLNALQSVGFYPPNSPVRDRTVKALVDLLDREFSAPEGVQINLRPGELLFAGQIVLKSGDDNWDVMARLFESGLRDLTFLGGIKASEISSLFELLSRTIKGELNPVDEDLSVLLWELDLPAVAYNVIDSGDEQSFFDVPTSAEDLQIEENSSLGDWEGLHPLGRYLASAGGLDNIDIDSRLLQVSQTELTTLLNAAKLEGRSLEPKLVALFSELLLLDLSRIEFARLMSLIHEYTMSLLKQGRFEVFVRMVARLGELGPKLNDEQTSELSQLPAKFSDVNSASNALAAVAAGKCDNEDAAIRFFGGLDFAGQIKVMNAVIPDLERSTPPVSSGILLRALTRTVSRKLDLFLQDPSLLREEHFTLLAKLLPENISARAAEQLMGRLNGLLSAPAVGIRIGVLRLMTAAGVPGLERVLQSTLEDEDTRVRIVGAELLSRTYGSKSLQFFLQVLLNDEFENRDFEEQAFFYEAMAKASPDEVFTFLERTIARRNWFAPPRWRIQKACALRALGMIPLEKAGPYLLKYRNSRDSFLAAASRNALEKHRFKLHGSPNQRRRIA